MAESKQLQSVPVHVSLIRQHLLMGCDRSLFLLLIMFVAPLTMAGVTQANLKDLLIAGGLMLFFVPVLRKLALYDEYFSPILKRTIRYPSTFLPSKGKPGNRPLVKHLRWA